MKSRPKRWLLLGCLFVIGSGLLVLHATRSALQVSKWVVASKPFFTTHTNAAGFQSVVAFVVSNASPATIDFTVVWFECRTPSNLNLLPAQTPGRRASVPLAGGAATNVEIEVASGRGADAQPLVCCQVNWMEREPRQRRWLRQVDRPMYWLAAFFDFSWNPPWRKKPFANGEVFTSNLKVADYFSRVYGFTAKQWLDEQRAKQKLQDELTRLQTNLAPSQALFVRSGFVPLPGGQPALDAKIAFDRFCQTSTNVAEEAEPDGVAGRSQPLRAETNRTSEAAGSHR